VNNGGLGVRRLGEFNLSLLGKWCWRLKVDKEGLWYRVLKARYGEEGGCIRDGGRYASRWWRMICNVQEGRWASVDRWFVNNIRRVVGDGRNTFFWTDNWVGGVPLSIQFSRLYELSVNKDCLVEEMERLGWEVGGAWWVWRRRLLAWEEDSARECVSLLNNVVLQENIPDRWRWMLDPLHGYSVSGTYRFLTNVEGQVANGVCKDVWHKFVPSKVSLFAWRLLQYRIPTRSNLLRRHVLRPSDNICVGGCGSSETADHLFIGCDVFGSVWYSICHWIGIPCVLPRTVTDHYSQFINMAGLPRSSHYYFKVIWLACTWAIWKERNNCIFKNAVIDPFSIVESVKLNSFFWLSSHASHLSFGFHDWWRYPLLCMGVM